MNAFERRLADLERLVTDRCEAEPRRDPWTLTDQEAVDRYRRLIARSPPRTEPFPEPDPEAVAELRRLLAR